MLAEFALEGYRVRLEPLAVEHAPDLAAAAQGDRATYGLTWVPDGLDDARRYIELALEGRDGGRQVPFAVRDLVSGQIAGSIRYLDLDVFPQPAPWPPAARGPEPSDDQPPTVAEIGSTWYGPAWQRSHVNSATQYLLLGHALTERFGTAPTSRSPPASGPTSASTWRSASTGNLSATLGNRQR